MTRLERQHTAVEARRQARYERVIALAGEGHSLREVAGWRESAAARCAAISEPASISLVPKRPADRMGVTCSPRSASALGGRRTQQCCPVCRDPRTRVHRRRFHCPAVCARMAHGSAPSWSEAARRDAEGSPPRLRHYSPRQTRWILLRPVEALEPDEHAFRQALCQESAAIAHAQTLAADFGRIVREQAHTELEAWLAVATKSRITELVSFARGLRRDLDAVMAALRSPYSQGQTEGHVNRLKMLKRQTFGRASFDLLRRRVPTTPPDRGTAFGQEPVLRHR